MSLPRVVAVAPGSPADRAGMQPGDQILALDGQLPRDIIEYHLLTDQPQLEVEVRRGGLDVMVRVTREEAEALGLEVDAALFDRVRTCDNHCELCFIHQLPKSMRKSLYLRDDDYRLSFLYGNFTTLTRFTEADLERVLLEGLSPLNVSIHATDPEVRAAMLRNRRGATSLRWLRALLDHGVTVHGQVVVCPGVNDGAVLEDTLTGVLDQYPELASLCLVPLGVSRYNTEPDMRPHTRAEAEAVVDAAAEWQAVYLAALGRRLVHAADEYYLLAGRPFPVSDAYEGFPMHEDGVGMARTFERELLGEADRPTGVQSGFFAWVDGAPAAGYRAPRNPAGDTGLVCANSSHVLEFRHTSDRDRPVAVLTGEYGARVLAPLLARLGRADVRVLPVANDFFGGNTAVTGLMVGADIARVLAGEPAGHRYLLPDVCLSEGRFLDGTTPADLPHPVEVVATDGIALREVLG